MISFKCEVGQVAEGYLTFFCVTYGLSGYANTSPVGWVNSFIVCPTLALMQSPTLGLMKPAQPTELPS